MKPLASFSLLAAGLAAASPLSFYSKALENRAISVSAADFSNFGYYVQYAAAAYCNSDNTAGQKITCSEDECPTAESNGATTVASFSGSGTGIAGFVATDPVTRQVIVSIRGSNNVRNWIANIEFAFASCDLVSNCKVHTGFQSAYTEIATPLAAAVSSALKSNPSYRLVITGHSLGGAVATFAAAHLRAAGYSADIYTFGSPRTGNAAFADFVTNQSGKEYRLTHNDDPVPRLPPIIFGYRHLSPEYWLHGGDGTTTDYEISDIVICEGDANISCNGGTLGLDVDAHLNYLQPVSGCGPGTLSWKRQEDVSDAELEQRLTSWAQADVLYVQGGQA